MGHRGPRSHDRVFAMLSWSAGVVRHEYDSRVARQELKQDSYTGAASRGWPGVRRGPSKVKRR